MARARRQPQPTPLREDEPAPETPANVEAEQAILGAILVNNSAYHAVAEALYEEHFFLPLHGRIWAAIARLIDEGHPADAVSLHPLFANDKAFAGDGEMTAPAYLARLIESAVTIVNARYYAETIIDAYRRRMLIGLAGTVTQRAYAYEAEDPVAAQVEDASAQLFDISEVGASRRRVVTAAVAAEQAVASAAVAYKNAGQLAGISSGIRALDRIVGGFASGDLYIVGGRPGSGKSSMMNSIAWAAAMANHPTLIFSGEMTAAQLMARMIAAITGISAGRQRRGDLTTPDWEEIATAQRTIAGWPMKIDDGPLTLPRIRQEARHAVRRDRVALILIDYLQLVSSGTESESRLADVGRVSNGLKRLAKDLGLPIIALAQLSRAVEARDDKRPLMSDLRYSGEVEQDADVIILLFRNEYYLAKAEPRQLPGEDLGKFQNRHAAWSNALADSRGKADAIVAKNRHDREGTAHIAFDAERTFFHDPVAAQQEIGF